MSCTCTCNKHTHTNMYMKFSIPHIRQLMHVKKHNHVTLRQIYVHVLLHARIVPLYVVYTRHLGLALVPTSSLPPLHLPTLIRYMHIQATHVCGRNVHHIMQLEHATYEYIKSFLPPPLSLFHANTHTHTQTHHSRPKAPDKW